MRLSDLKNGEEGVVSKVVGHGSFRKRIIEMGFIKGKTVKVIKNAPLKDPIEYKILDYEVSLRRSEANMIEVVTPEEAENLIQSDQIVGTMHEERLRDAAFIKRKSINIAIIGNPNSGKTSLFNHITGLKEHVGNYSGVTVELKEGKYKHNGYEFNFTDLPGTYSLSTISPDEVFVRRYLRDKKPDIVINVVSASNLERNLYLTTQLIDMDLRLVMALNMYDELEKSGASFEHNELSKMVGVPIIPTKGTTGEGITDLLDRIISVYEGQDDVTRHVHIYYGEETEAAIKRVRQEIAKYPTLTSNQSPRFLAINLLANDSESVEFVKTAESGDQLLTAVAKIRKKLEMLLADDCETIITEAKYGFISGALKETYKESTLERVDSSKIIDAFATHKVWGFPIFFFLLWLMFKTTFTLGAFPADWIDALFVKIGEVVSNAIPPGPISELLVDGIISGVGSVIVFVPNIMLLFLFISLFEDSGYMARAAFIMDKLMHKMGLHGKSFIPMIMGFGCNVPAVMATRTIENRNNRIVTMLINPLMSCSARLPVYILICGTFFPASSSIMLFTVYLTGAVLAILMALIFKKSFFKREDNPFVMELPPYRMPSFRKTMRHTWHKTSMFLKKIGGIVLVTSVLIWFLSNYPKQQENMAHQPSYLEQAGKVIEPVIKPLGFDWKVGVGLATGFLAKELIVSTLSVLDADTPPSDTVSPSSDKGSLSGITTPAAIALLIFTLIYSPCIATVAAIKNESGELKWALFSIAYSFTLAWILAFAINQIGLLIVK